VTGVSGHRLPLVERAMGARVLVQRGKVYHLGRIVFADYESFCVLVEGDQRFFVSLREVKVLSLRRERMGVMHGVRLNPWQHGEGWEGCHIAAPEVAEVWLEPLVERVAA